MERETSSLLIKANRVLGMRLVEAGLTTSEAMEEANTIFIERARAKDLARASLLRILLFELGSLKETDLLNHELDTLGIGAVLPENFRTDPCLLDRFPLELMRASWTIPIDYCEGNWFLVSAYYMSDVVRSFWEERLEERIFWYTCSMEALDGAFQGIEADALSRASQDSREGD